MQISHDELLIGYKAIAERLECSHDTVRRMIRDDALPVFSSQGAFPRQRQGGARPRVWTTGLALHLWATARALGVPPQAWRKFLQSMAAALLKKAA